MKHDVTSDEQDTIGNVSLSGVANVVHASDLSDEHTWHCNALAIKKDTTLFSSNLKIRTFSIICFCNHTSVLE